MFRDETVTTANDHGRVPETPPVRVGVQHLPDATKMRRIAIVLSALTDATSRSAVGTETGIVLWTQRKTPGDGVMTERETKG